MKYLIEGAIGAVGAIAIAVSGASLWPTLTIAVLGGLLVVGVEVFAARRSRTRA